MYKSGFTLVETLIAITVLLIAIVAPMTLAQEGILAARLAEDQIVAFYMAQEGVELVRNIRDENKYDGNPMLASPLDVCIVAVDSTEPGCYIDATNVGPDASFSTQSCSSGGCPVVRTDGTIYAYTAAGFENTKFTRNIRTWYVPGSSNDEMRVEVTVTWPFRQSTRTYTLRSNLTNW